MDIFLSYRRDNGSDRAALIKEKLQKRGVEVFLDRHNIQNEDFWENIKHHIDLAPNFLILLTPGYFAKRRGKEDYVRKEVIYAKQQGKNIIGISFEGYNHEEINWEEEKDPIIKTFERFNSYPYEASNEDVEKASISHIIKLMKDEKGNRFSVRKKTVANDWYAEHEMGDDDRLWILSDHDVCKRLDWSVLGRILQEDIFKGRDNLNILTYKAYDIDTYKKKYELDPDKEYEKTISGVYGITYQNYVDHANELFGEGHFVNDRFESKEYSAVISKLLHDNNLPGFDIIDMTLVLKDTSNPERRVRDLVKYLNPRGGVIYVRDLDDDYLDAYPDPKNYIKTMKNYFDLDDGAGNRHTGKKIFTFLKKAGAKSIFMSDEVITTANRSSQYQQRLCDTYFSYLVPEMRALAAKKNSGSKNYDKYVDAYEWLKENYDDFESFLCSSELYFRAGYVTGYGVFKYEDDF